MFTIRFKSSYILLENKQNFSFIQSLIFHVLLFLKEGMQVIVRGNYVSSKAA